MQTYMQIIKKWTTFLTGNLDIHKHILPSDSFFEMHVKTSQNRLQIIRD